MTPTQVSDPAEPALPLGQASQSVTLQTCELDTRLVFEATKFWGWMVTQHHCGNILELVCPLLTC